MKCIIAGSRGATREQVFAAMDTCPFANQITGVISGAARGADTYGEEWARSKNIPVHRKPADWNKYGKSAGYRRNEEMAIEAGTTGALVAVWDGASKGTKHMIDLATKHKVAKVFIYITSESTENIQM